MTKKAVRPVLRYHGGKFQLAPWIISHFPDHRVYTEVFGGGASVLLRKKRSYAEVYNDLDGEIVNIFRVLRDPAQSKELQRQLELTPFSRDEFNAAYEPSDNPIEQARRTMIRSFMGHGSDAVTGQRKTGFRDDTTRAVASDWKNFSDYIPLFHDRFKGVMVENRNAMEVLANHDSEKSLHYVDPPYLFSTRSERAARANAYRHELTDEQHHELATALHELKGMVVLSGYPSPLYSELYPSWQCITKPTHADRGLDRIECLWLNPAATRQQIRLEV